MLLVIFFLFCCVAIFSLKAMLFIVVEDSYLSVNFKIMLLHYVCVYKRNISISGGASNSSNSKKLIYSRVYSIIKRLKLNVKFLKLHIDLSAGDAATTAVLTGIIRAVIPIILKYFDVKIKQSKCEICINPIYNENVRTQLKFRCIISQNVVHIISKIFIEWRREKYGRKTSHRGSYGNSHE